MIQANQYSAFDCDFSNDHDCGLAKLHCPSIYTIHKEYDIRGIHINYITVNDKLWGSVGFITQHTDAKKLTPNVNRMLQMVAHIIELAATRKKMVVDLQLAMKETQAALKTKNNFIATISHEIRTPLNAVLGFTELLRDSDIDSSQRNEYLQNISNAGKALLALINDILDLAKLTAGKMTFTPSKCNLAQMVSQMGTFFQHQFKTKNVQFKDAVPAGFPMVWVDQIRMRQILFNLIGNTIKFTNNGSITVSLLFEKETEEEGTLTINVIDTGIGISEEDLKTIGQPFIQTGFVRGTATDNKGTGLGISICKKLLESMNGEQSIKSILQQGSTFSAKIHHIKYDEQANSIEETNTDFIAKPSLLDLSRLSVLAVDDVAMNLFLLKTLLKKFNIEADTAKNAEEALAFTTNRKYDYILTDFWMPDLNGVDLARRIRKERQGKHPFIVVVTADAEANEHFDFSIFDAVLTKPITTLSLEQMFAETM